MEVALERLVQQRASNRCEYCQLPQALSDLSFHIDHVTAQKHGGPTTAENLALACIHCNLHKGTDLTGIDPVTGRITRLFHPRQDDWHEHFLWAAAELIGVTDVGRTTIAVLAINNPDAVAARAALIAEGRFPPHL
jgi:hypothetical protein